jgi:hypothetical protein
VPKREIFIGDIQGCYDEFLDLLKACEHNPTEDRLYLAGDMINRGPKSGALLEDLMERPQVQCVLGNHEYFYLKDSKAKKSFKKLDREFGPKKELYKKWLAQWPFFLESETWLLIHGGLLPGQHPSTMDPEVLTTLRFLPNGKAWYDEAIVNKTTIFGHWAERGFVQQGHFWGLDSGCVYGGKLSALILPEKKLVSVPARRVYCVPKLKNTSPAP